MADKMKAAASIIAEVKTLEEAYDYAIAVCDEKAPYESLTRETRDEKAPKLLVIPGLSEKDRELVQQKIGSRNVRLMQSSMRQHLGGVDVVLTVGEYGIAHTGTCVLDSGDEELRLATMIAEEHVMVIKKSTIVERMQDLAKTLTSWQSGSRYIAFISGASRTADIERVLAIGVHGPLKFHLVLLEG